MNSRAADQEAGRKIVHENEIIAELMENDKEKKPMGTSKQVLRIATNKVLRLAQVV